MCTKSCLRFGQNNINKEDVENKDVIEIGSYNVNGSLRPYTVSLMPRKYIGVDIKEGQFVDIICNAENVLDKFGKESFDLVITTEMMEHVENWRKVISNLKNICKENGVIILTTRSKGFGKHDFPSDYWRYEIDDMKQIFSDFIIESIEKDSKHPGVFVRTRKPKNFVEKDLSGINLFRI